MSTLPKNKKISDFKIIIIFFLCSVTGIFLLTELPVQLTPDSSLPSLTIQTTTDKSTPEITERTITIPIEKVLSRLKGIETIKSSSGANYSIINLSFQKWTDPVKFKFEANSQLRALFKTFPNGTVYPNITLDKAYDENFNDVLLNYGLLCSGLNNAEMLTLRSKILPAIKKNRGISNISVQYARDSIVIIHVFPAKLKSFGLSITDITEAVSRGITGNEYGLTKIKSNIYNISFESQILSIQDIYSFPIKKMEDRLITMKDVCELKLSLSPISSYHRINGREVISIDISAAPNINTIELSNRIQRKLDSVAKTLSKDISLVLLKDNTKPLRSELYATAFRAVLSIVILVVFIIVFTKRIQYISIIIISLFANICIAFNFYYICRVDIHLYSIVGITISLGMVIDNTIIIIEDIQRHRKNRIFSAIVAATFTTFGSLIALFFLPEEQQVNIIDFAKAIIIMLAVSLPIAYFLIPSLLFYFPFKNGNHQRSIAKSRLLIKFNHFYYKQLCFMLRYRNFCIICMILIFGIPVFLLPRKIEDDVIGKNIYNSIFGSDFYNSEIRDPLNKYLGGFMYLYISSNKRNRHSQKASKDGDINIRILPSNGSTIDQLNNATREFERCLKNYNKEISYYTIHVNDNEASILIKFKPHYNKHFPFRLKSRLEELASNSGSVETIVYGIGDGFSNQLNEDLSDATLVLKGYDYTHLMNIAKNVQKVLLQNVRVEMTQISSEKRNYVQPNKEFEIDLSSRNSSYLSDIRASDLRQSFSFDEKIMYQIGVIINTTNDFYPLFIENEPELPPDVWTLLHSPIPSKDSSYTKLSKFGQLNFNVFHGNIKRENMEYVLNIHYRYLGSYESNDVFQKSFIEKMQSGLALGYSISQSFADSVNSKRDSAYLWVIPMALFIIFIIVAALLESISKSIAILIMVPISFTGVFIFFYLFEIGFDEGAYASLLMLCGLVCNMCLYVINDLNHYFMTKSHQNHQDEIRTYIKSFAAKAGPILITAMASIVSLLPFLFTKEDDGFWFTLSIGTIGGLIVSIFCVYLILPIFILHKPTNKK
ncbi:efflux RND transporter permease subunit [Pedobacter sp. AW31-3R]|uniref:efflux RND transporter permease subunit n=1 Tax=Pedobacter sp. AW31-3R TaxID=3445781 RepID=UPI003FA111B6